MYGEWIVPNLRIPWKYGEWIVPNLRIPWKRRRSSLPYIAVGTCEILNGIDWDYRRETSGDVTATRLLPYVAVRTPELDCGKVWSAWGCCRRQ
ncbi:unnamed protein product [Pleuronectes platessa]|uniref:Uncharacterized protein n=1 Tax=Pleuronectes platessa TaxID=8262 RepID=A0A9N7U6S8_PLEPL|nr:unnamed protein product [Pleuronectes platessa]